MAHFLLFFITLLHLPPHRPPPPGVTLKVVSSVQIVCENIDKPQTLANKATL